MDTGWGTPRAMPVNLEAEQALLGALLANNRAYERIGFLQPQHFADPIHGAIFSSIQRRCEAGRVADPVTIKADFDGTGVLDPVGGIPYLAQLLSAMVGIINAGDYGRLVHEAWIRREIIAAADGMAASAYDPSNQLDGAAQLEAAEAALARLSGERSGLAAETPISVASGRVLDTMQAAIAGVRPTIYSTGFPEIDAVIGGGLRPKQEILLGGRPGHGKSSLALQMQMFFARTYGLPSLNITIEMTSEEQAGRAISMETRVPSWRMELGDVSPAEADAILRCQREMASLNIAFDDRPGLNFPDIRRAARRFRQRHGKIGLLIIDHLHLVKPDHLLLQSAGLAYAVGEISTRLKELAKEEDVPVLALCQLNRNKESADDKMPTNGDLRNSGDLEANADTILFVHRPELHLHKAKPARKPNESDAEFSTRDQNYLQALQDARGKGFVNCTKARKGKTGTVEMLYDGETTSFRSRLT